MTDEQSMIRAVLADPADDVPRLAFADWLDEHDQPERAEFIRDCCGALQQHTDCPVRLADIKGRRPVPLRCGVCEYCVARRRGERYYASHRWLDGHSYAVAFEPTPLDGDMPSVPGVTLTVRRGFVAEVRCTLAAFVGGACGRCNGHGSLPGIDEGYCDRCSGTGRTPGVAADLFASHPVEKVSVTDLTIWPSGGNDTYYLGGVSVFPAKYWGRLEGLPSPRAVQSEAEAVALEYGRELAGLPVLKGVTK